MREPAAPARHRRGEEPAAGREAHRLQRLGALVQGGVDDRGVARVLDGRSTIALNEGQDDVFALQPGEQLRGRGILRLIQRLGR